MRRRPRAPVGTRPVDRHVVLSGAGAYAAGAACPADSGVRTTEEVR
ncbi:hypothetical protein HGI15_15105 [Modestobacter lapidis]|nr:hypothetical protein [Modestobacter lapidis]